MYDRERPTDREAADQNPYEAPSTELGGEGAPQPPLDDPRLARRFTRLAAVIVDYIFVECGLGAGMLVNLALGAQFDRPFPMVFGLLTMLGIEAWLIATRGQSAGKIAFGIRVVSDAHGRTPDVFYGLFVRYGLWLVPGFLYLDPWFIFGRRRKCLHDLAAGTRVVLVDPPRATDSAVAETARAG